MKARRCAGVDGLMDQTDQFKFYSDHQRLSATVHYYIHFMLPHSEMPKNYIGNFLSLFRNVFINGPAGVPI